ncbi:MAG: hypothetical protein H6Q17_2056 [Bacteroidetes bacterium]|nr:hypothetical protein [Bacteroidota bacterium]
MKTNDFVPRSDTKFNIWQNNLISETETNGPNWGIVSESIAPLKPLQAKWISVFTVACNKQNRTSADVQAKDDARYDFEPALRSFVAEYLTSNSKVSDADRTRLGLNVRSESRTSSPVPDSCPVGRIDFSARQQHTIHFSDEATPTSRAKPDGVHGCEIWMKVGEAPASVADLTYLTTDTATPYVVTFNESDAGKTAYYRLRWVNTRNERGPWSALISATIAG